MSPITGSCLCGAVQIEVDAFTGPFELCHCTRCRKLSGSAFMPASAPAAEHFRFVAGQDRIETFEAPILRSQPAYLTCFCQVCGSPTPAPHVDGEFVEIPAGMLNDDPGLRPDKHILTEHRAGWHVIDDDLPQFDREGIDAHRVRQKDPKARTPMSGSPWRHSNVAVPQPRDGGRAGARLRL